MAKVVDEGGLLWVRGLGPDRSFKPVLEAEETQTAGDGDHADGQRPVADSSWQELHRQEGEEGKERDQRDLPRGTAEERTHEHRGQVESTLNWTHPDQSGQPSERTEKEGDEPRVSANVHRPREDRRPGQQDDGDSRRHKPPEADAEQEVQTHEEGHYAGGKNPPGTREPEQIRPAPQCGEQRCVPVREVADRRLVELVQRVRIDLTGPEEDGDGDGHGGERAEDSERRRPTGGVGRGLRPSLVLHRHARLAGGAPQQGIRHITFLVLAPSGLAAPSRSESWTAGAPAPLASAPLPTADPRGD